MEKFQTQFKEATKDILLSEADKALMRERLVEYMEYKPIRGVSEKNVSTKFVFPYFRAHHFSGAFLIAVLIASSSFGVSYAAADALPGDFILYSVKVNINEEIKTAFLSSDESKITWEQERAERRLVEASQLAAEGRLDEQKQEQVSKLFAEHTENMVKQVRAVEETDPVSAAELSSMFEDSLDAHEAVLARLIVEQEDGDIGGARGLVEQVRTASNEVEKIRNDAEGKIEIDESEVNVVGEDKTEVDVEQTEVAQTEDTMEKTESANLRVRAAYRAQERAQELLATVKELQATLDPESELALQAQAQIVFGEELTLSGVQALENNNLGDAYGKYRKASASFQKVIQLLEVANLFSVEIYPDKEPAENEVSDESELNENGEIITNLESIRASVEKEISTARTLLLTQEGYEDSVAEKANSHIKDASAHMMRGEIAMVMEDYIDAKALFEQAHKLISETVLMLEDVSRKEEINEVTIPEVVPPVEVEETPEERVLVLSHQYADGTHTYSGELTLGTPCQVLEENVLVGESFPEQIIIEFTTHDPSEGTVCVQVTSDREFLIETKASEEAKVVGVKLNGVVQSWEIVKANPQGEIKAKQEKKALVDDFDQTIESSEGVVPSTF